MLRQAIPEDAQAIGRLYRTLAPWDGHVRVTPERIARVAEDPHNFLFVLEDAGRVAATALLTLCLDPMYGDLPFAVLENLVVDPGRQGQGWGRRLVGGVEAFCWERRCTKIMLLSSRFRKEAHAFFARMGFSGDKKAAFVKYRSDAYDAVLLHGGD